MIIRIFSFLAFAILIFLFNYVNCYKILVFSPVVSRSHMLSNARVADTLAAAGHDVTLFEPDFLKLFDKIETSKIAKRFPVFGFSDALKNVLNEMSGDVFEEKSYLQTVSNNNRYLTAYNEHCRDLINRDELIEQLRAEKFDAYFGEQINLCGHGLAKAIGIKTYFWISSCPVDDIVSNKLGLPMPLSYASSLIGYRLPPNPNFFQRAYNILASMGYIYYISITDHDLSVIFKEKFGPDFPDINEIAIDSDLIFVMTDEFLEVQKPIMPNFVHVGGLGLANSNEEGQIDEKTAKEMEKGKNGVVYFSLGTTMNSSMLQPFVMKTVMETAKAFPDYHFVIKVDSHDPNAWKFAKGISNVYVTDWVAQRALLVHPRLRVFITHCGYNGLIEAARAGVPLVAIPLIFDQARNSLAVEQTGWGVALPKESLRDDPKALQLALREVLGNEKYKKSAMRLKNLIRTKPFKAEERLIKYTQFVLDNGGMKELISPARHLPTIILYNLDVYAIFIAVIMLTTYFLFKFIILLFSFFFTTSKNIDSSRNGKVKLN